MNYAIQTTTFNPPVESFLELNESLFKAWIDYLDAKPATVQSYTKKIFKFYQWLMDNGITRPTRSDVIDFRDELAATCKANTVNAYLAAIKQFFLWTSSTGIYLNVAANVKRLKVDSGFKHQYLTTRQCNKLLQSVDVTGKTGKRDYAMLLLMMTTGLRTIEISRANIEDIKPRGDDTVLYIQGKGKDDKSAFVKLPPKTEDAIRELIKSFPDDHKTGPLFPSSSNRNCFDRLSSGSISRIVKAYLVNIGLNADDITAHSLRHTAATINMLSGGTLEDTKGLLRHSDVSVTLQYSHAIERDSNQSEYRIEAAILG